MKAEEKELLRFLEGTDKNFIIPIYQRNYDWKKDNCNQLFDDLENLLKKNLESHFFGSVVCKPEDMERIIIIDGQQRITTISLLLLAIYNYIKNNNISVEGALDEKILNEYLINKYSPKEKKIKLKPIKKDQLAFEKLFDNNCDDVINNSNLTQNYKYLYERVENSKYTVNQLYDAIKKLMVVVIQLHENDNPQLIFESMNSTGLDLTEADKIRNFILMDKPYDVQDEYYEKYWNKIEENVDYNSTDFIKDYLTIKMSKIPTYNSIYKVFKEDFIISNNRNILEVLQDMYNYSNNYAKVINANTGNDIIDGYLRDINYLKYTLLYPFITQVISRYNNNEYSAEVVQNTLKALITYVVRRIVCAKPTNALPKFFCTLDREIENIIRKDNISMELYDDVFTYIIENRKGYVEFPGDDEFKESFIKFKLYKMQNQVKNYILRELENYKNKERITINSIEDKGKISIEHVMPQTLTPAWKNDLGVNYAEIYEKYLDTIGNLTLTAYNPELQNKPYNEKRPTYLKSKMYLSSFFDSYKVWNEDTIIDRGEKLAQRALEVWDEPRTEYVETENEDVIFDLSETEISFINTKIVSFKFDSKEYPVKNWKDFENQLVAFLYDLDKIPLIELAEKHNRDTDYSNKRFATKESDLRSPIKVDENLFIESNYNSDALVDFVRMVVEAYGLELDEIEIKLEENKTAKKGIYDYSTLSRVSKDEVKRMYEELDQRILEIDPNIEKIFNKHYVAYRLEQNFIELHFHVDWLTLYMFPNANYDDPLNKMDFIKDRTWTLTGRLYVKPEDDLNYILDLINKSYEYIKKRVND